MKKIKFYACFWIFMTGFAIPIFSQSIQIVTEEFPPYNYKENGKLTGHSTEVVRAILKELKLKDNIKAYPWARAYNMALNDKNTLIYSIGKNKKREHLFKWVGIIAPADFYLFALKGRAGFKIRKLDDAKGYKIGTVREDLREQYLLGKGFERNVNIFSNNTHEANLQKLLHNRLDLWTMPELTAFHILRKNGYNPKATVKKVYHLNEISTAGYFMAFHIDTDDELVKGFATALAKIKRNRTFYKILKKYL